MIVKNHNFLLGFELQTLHFTKKCINEANDWCHKKIWLDCMITTSACNYTFAYNYWFCFKLGTSYWTSSNMRLSHKNTRIRGSRYIGLIHKNLQMVVAHLKVIMFFAMCWAEQAVLCKWSEIMLYFILTKVQHHWSVLQHQKNSLHARLLKLEKDVKIKLLHVHCISVANCKSVLQVVNKVSYWYTTSKFNK